MGKYDGLAIFLENLPEEQQDVELSFARIDRLVGGLPPSSKRLRTWWANNSQGQSLAWSRAGWHVRRVDLGLSHVTFSRGQIGGSYAARVRTAATSTAVSASPEPDTAPTTGVDAPWERIETVDARVVFEWHHFGVATVDATGKVSFSGTLPASPGLYRFTLTGGALRPRVYIGESENLRRRLNTNYRNPGPRQQTSLRINALLIEHLLAGGHVTVDISVEAALHPGGPEPTPLDLTRKAGRLLAESAALVLAQHSADADIENLG